MQQTQKEPYYRRHFRKIIALYTLVAIITTAIVWHTQLIQMVLRIAAIFTISFFFLFTESKFLLRLSRHYSHNMHDIFKVFGIIALTILCTTFPAISYFQNASILFSSQAQAFGQGLNTGFEFFWISIFAEFYLNRWNCRFWIYAIYWVIVLALQLLYSRFDSDGVVFFIRAGIYTLVALLVEKYSRLSGNKECPKKDESRQEVREFLDQLKENIIIYSTSLKVKYFNLSELAHTSRERISVPGLNLSDIVSQKQDLGSSNARGLTILDSPQNTELPTERKLLLTALASITNQTEGDTKSDHFSEPIKLLENIRCLPAPGSSKIKLIFPKLFASVEKSPNCFCFLNSVASNPSVLQELQYNKQRFVFKGVLPKNELNEDIHFELHLSAVKFEGEDACALVIKDETHLFNESRESSQIHINILNSVSHELRTPLNCSLNVLEEALNSGKINQEIRENFIVPALTNTKLLSYFVDDVMSYLHVQRQAIKITARRKSLNRTLHDCANMVQYSLKRRSLKLKVEIQYHCELFFTTDHHRLSQIVLNLLVNAVKFTFKGEITLGLKISKIDEVLIYVEDTGVGLSAKEIEKLRGKVGQGNFGIDINDKGTGAGLGLIISNSLLSFLSPTRKEKIQIESSKGKGSIFSFVIQDLSKSSVLAELRENPGVELDALDESMDLSISHDNVSNRFRMNEYQMHPRPNSLCHANNLLQEFKITEIYSQEFACKCPPILVVDDDCFNIVTIENMLKSLGKSCDIAFNGELAIKKIQDRHLSPCSKACQVYELIIMDCNMPIMDGYEATKLITEKIKQQVWKKMTVVGCTAYVCKEKLDKCIESGMDSYINKPITKDKIRELVRYIKN